MGGQDSSSVLCPSCLEIQTNDCSPSPLYRDLSLALWQESEQGEGFGMENEDGLEGTGLMDQSQADTSFKIECCLWV